MRKEIRFAISYSEYQNLRQFLNIIMHKDENSAFNRRIYDKNNLF